MNKSFVFLLTWSIFSCNQFATEKVNEQKLVEKELQAINWNEVDQYPSFTECNELNEKEALKNCFVTKVGQTISQIIQPSQNTVSVSIDQTIMLQIAVDEKGALELVDAIIPEVIFNELPKIDSLLHASVQKVENIQPALKRGQPVKTMLKLPIRIKTE